jgi:proteasome lid subunit RPN8/RPN11
VPAKGRARPLVSTTTPHNSIRLVLPESLARQIEREGESGYPNEICGMLIGRDVTGPDGRPRRMVDRLEPGRNVFEAGEQYHRFSIDPRDQLKAERAAEQQGRMVLGYYHSHPDHLARPSEYDREHAWPFYSYAIVEIAKGKAADLTSWVLNDETKQFERQLIERTT